MPGATVRISWQTRDALRDLAEREGVSMQAVIEKALEAYRRERFLEEVNAAYARLRQDEPEWSRLQAERQEWDATLADGLPDEEWAEDGTVSTAQAKGERQ